MDDLEKRFEGSLVGVCERVKSGEVVFQNDVCRRLCGDWVGKVCTIGCRKGASTQMSVDEFGFSLVRDSHQESLNFIDSVKLVTIGNEFTFLFDRSEIILRLMKQLSDFKVTKMEAEVYFLILRGHSNAEIAELLFISKNTVRNHISNLRRKIPRKVFPKRTQPQK